MKKWSGGTLILVLSFVLLVRYTFIVLHPTKQTKQSAYDFFRNHVRNDTEARQTAAVAKSKIRVNAKRPEEKPFLIDVKGLSELYDGSVNISRKDSYSLATWTQLRAVLARSDALPETAKGVEEASVAWRELLSVIKRDEFLQIKSNASNANVANDIKCPFAVSTFDEPVNSSRNVLEIPCGLIEDSSVTLIGIPNGKNETFQIELEGAGFVHEQKPPIILKYSVYLPEENSTKEPVIIQNTWTSEAGWGKEEKCFRGRSTSNIQDSTRLFRSPLFPQSVTRVNEEIFCLAITIILYNADFIIYRYTSSLLKMLAIVDGLASCNEQLVGSTMEKSQNVSQSVTKKQNNSSMEHGHVRENFPFMEGNLFSATLWTGLEGFHMTVNGRHETSFKYKENLEPWLVSKVRVTGGVSILSGIAKGLPVSEDLDLIIDVDQLKAPPLLRKKGRLVLFVGVFSTGNNFERRMALRRSWMQYQAVRSGSVAVRFIIGFHKNADVNHDLWREAQAYGDIQLMPFVDYYSLISLKTIAVCILGTKVFPAKYIMKMDDDAFVRIDELLSSLKEKTANGLLYGLISFQSSPHRNTDSKWYVSNKEWPKDSYPPWAHGPGYIISRDIAKFIVQGHQRKDLKLFKLEDVAMGIWIENYKDNNSKVKYFTDDRFYNAGCDTDYILAHYQNPRKLLCLWEKLQKERQAICCE